MIIDFRYHIASLVAIFIALALGILMGSTLVGDDFVENLAQEQKIWISRLEKDYLNLKNETENLKKELNAKETELAYYKNFLEDVKPYLVKGKLSDQKFALIELDNNLPLQTMINTLEQSGGEIISSIRLNLVNGDLADFQLEKVYKLIGSLIIAGEYCDEIKTLEEKGIIKSMGNYDKKVDGVIVITGKENKNKILEKAEKQLINTLQYSLPTYIIERGNLENNIKSLGLKESKQRNYLDTLPGQVSLILSIFERNNGFAQVNGSDIDITTEELKNE